MSSNELYSIALFDEATDDEMAWMLAHSTEQPLELGAYFMREGERANGFYVVLEGELQITRRIDGHETVVGTTPRGIIGGELALLADNISPNSARAIMPSRLRVFDQQAFRTLFTHAPTVGIRILRIAAERMQGLASIRTQQEKMAALGKLSAGLAHELNNPASAARRAASTLRETLPTLSQLTVRLCGLGLNDAQFEHLLAFEQAARAADHPPLAPLEQSDREAAIGDWLDEQGVDEGWEFAATFVAAGLAVETLHDLVDALPPDSMGAVLAWLHGSLNAAELLGEIEHSTGRIAELVGAVKSYTYMDQAPIQEVDIRKGLETTLTVLHHTLKNVNVLREYDPDLPTIQGRGGELNQVWTNLIANAADAMHGSGTLRVLTRCEQHFVMVEITDNGPGIPEALKNRIFEPFFTTKGVGEGTGMGLDITYRIVRQHNGTIEVRSQPGNTRFIVRLPVSHAASAETSSNERPANERRF